MAQRLHYETVGDRSLPHALLIHGFMSSNHQWGLNLDALKKHLCLTMVELWGHGSSPAPTDVDRYRISSYLAEFEHIRTELGIAHWWVLGQSLGGAMALRYGLHHPEQTRGVIFTNSRAAFAQARVGADQVERLSGPNADLRALPYHPINAKRFPDDLKARMVEAADAMQPHALQHTVRNRESVSSVDDFGQLRVPVLLINGRWEKLFQEAVPLARAALPSLAIVELEGGHSINVEAPDGFNDAVISFVASHQPDDPAT